MLLPEDELIVSRNGPQLCCAPQLACDRAGKLAAQSASANNAADRLGASIGLERLGPGPWGWGGSNVICSGGKSKCGKMVGTFA